MNPNPKLNLKLTKNFFEKLALKSMKKIFKIVGIVRE
jgi:hypothetical protein